MINEITSLSIVTVTKNRPAQLINTAGNSLNKQSNYDFEWLVISDGECALTKNAIEKFRANSPFPVKYWQIKSQSNQFGLCVGRNVGIAKARSKYITYLDDDNSFTPNFVNSILKFFIDHPSVNYCTPLVNRTRGVWNHEQLKITCNFISPRPDTTIPELLTHQQLFDSNGFIHLKNQCPQWNPNYRIYCDYEYFLQCSNSWSLESFALIPQVLVNYLQTTEGVIGQSKYEDWAIELEKIIENKNNYSVLLSDFTYLETLQQLQQSFKAKQQKSSVPKAFKLN